MERTTRSRFRGSRIRRYLINACVLIVSALLSLLLVEVGIRIFMPQKLITQYKTIWRPDSITGWRHKESIATSVNSGEGLVSFVTDSDGFRINTARESSEPAPAKRRYSILFIGDSFLEAIQVENRFTIPQVIRRTLSSPPDLDVAVTSDGVGGWNPNQYYLEAQRLSSKQYDLAIVFLYAANDIICQKVDRFSPREVAPRHFRMPKRFTFGEITSAILYPINETLKVHSHAFVFFKNRTKWLRMKLGLSPYYFADVLKTDMHSSPCWQVTTDVCRLIHDEFSRHGAQSLFVLLPADYQADPSILESYMKAFSINASSVDVNQPEMILKQRFEESSLVLIDPLEQMRTQTKEGKKLYGFIDSHMNAEGHSVVANFLAPTIKAMISDPAAAPRPPRPVSPNR